MYVMCDVCDVHVMCVGGVCVCVCVYVGVVSSHTKGHRGKVQQWELETWIHH